MTAIKAIQVQPISDATERIVLVSATPDEHGDEARDPCPVGEFMKL